MSEQAQEQTEAQGGTALGAMLAQKIREAGEMVSGEIEQLRAEVNDRAAMGAQGAAMLAGAGAAGAVALVAAASLPLMALRRVMPGWAVAVVVAGGSGALAAVLARRGLDDLSAAAPTTNGGPP